MAASAPAPDDAAAPPRRLRLVVSGAEGAGKTALLRRLVEGRFSSKYVPTVGVDYGIRPMAASAPPSGGAACEGAPAVRLNFFDLGGGAPYAEVRNEFYRDADVVSRGRWRDPACCGGV
jgi:DnaJ homolog subfamily C member 27